MIRHNKKTGQIYDMLTMREKKSKIQKILEENGFAVTRLDIKHEHIYVDANRIGYQYSLIIPKWLTKKVLTIDRLMRYNTKTR